MIKPKALKNKDTIGLIAPSGSVIDIGAVDLTIKKLTELGFRVKAGKSCYLKYGYLAGKDEDRAKDVNAMFSDGEIDGVLCLKGGYGACRILDMLDYDVIRKNPKVFIGYSDITAIHLALQDICGLVTFHGPVGIDLVNDFDAFTKESFMKALTCNEPLGNLYNPADKKIECLVKGETSGNITGGNLSLIAATIGTRYEMDVKGKILLLEDIGEEPYRVDRMLSQLRLSGKLEDCNGIIIGDWNNCDPTHPEHSLSLAEVFNDIIVPFNKPTIYNFMAGHCKPKITIPFGVKTVLNATACQLTVIERATL